MFLHLKMLNDNTNPFKFEPFDDKNWSKKLDVPLLHFISWKISESLLNGFSLHICSPDSKEKMLGMLDEKGWC